MYANSPLFINFLKCSKGIILANAQWHTTANAILSFLQRFTLINPQKTFANFGSALELLLCLIVL